jgi:hypothetical protein
MPQTMDQKREGAAKRQAAYDALTPEDKLARIEERRGASAKERLKLLSKIESRGKTKPKRKRKKKETEDAANQD